ncbi:SRPBCC family protein [Flavobacterium rhizosphaerae]|uniref:SRPBCC family protein n=1 Tax=Flavobacterium rhizosphaerae TaxID=3163298 RepID=A0ABW8YUL2_9FLAO
MKSTIDKITGEELNKNIGDIERVVSLAGGVYLLYDAIKREKRNLFEIAAAGFMIYRGAKGFAESDLGKALFKKPRKRRDSNVNVHTRLIINRSVSEVYTFWRHLANLPLFMEHLEEVRVIDDVYSEWKAKLPALNKTISWKAEIVGEEPNKFIGWQSLPGSSIRNAGKVQFKDAGEMGTLVHVIISYHAPLGHAGEEVAKLLTPVFEDIVRKDIMGFKRYMETGTSQRLQQETVKIYS